MCSVGGEATLKDVTLSLYGTSHPSSSASNEHHDPIMSHLMSDSEQRTVMDEQNRRIKERVLGRSDKKQGGEELTERTIEEAIRLIEDYLG